MDVTVVNLDECLDLMQPSVIQRMAESIRDAGLKAEEMTESQRDFAVEVFARAQAT